MINEIRISLRSLFKTPGFMLVVILTLAIGIGANTSIFSVVNAVLLLPSGISHPERVVAVRVKYDKLNLSSISVSATDFADVLRSTQTFQHAAIVDQADFAYSGAGLPERLQGALVSAQWFAVFGAKPELGRVFSPEEDDPSANQEVILSHSTWNRLFGGDPGVLGRSMELDGKLYRVIGVMPPEFRQPIQTDLWTPLALAPKEFGESNRFNESYFAAARLRPGVTFEQANSSVHVLSDLVRGGNDSGAYARSAAWGMFAVPITDFLAGDTKKPLLVLLTAVGFVLLIACANIAGLMLARASGKTREFAIQSALGAGAWDLIRRCLWESLLLSCAGAALGLAFTFFGIRVLLSLAPERLAAGLVIPVNGRVLLFTAVVSVFSGLLFGLAPALQIARKQFGDLKDGGRSGTAGHGRQAARAVLVVSEVALALVLLVGAGLFVRSLSRIQQIGTGFNPAGVVVGTLALPKSHYEGPEKQAAFFRDVTEHLTKASGVTAAAAAIPVPFSGGMSSGSFNIEGLSLPPGEPEPHADVRSVGPGYFQAMSIPLRAGRVFADGDRIGTEPVVIVDENLARQYWPNQNPVGRHVRRGSRGSWSTVVGVVSHVKQSDLAGETGKGVYYAPTYQMPRPYSSFVLKTEGDPARLATTLREAVHAVDPSLPLSQVKTLRDMVASSLDARRFVVVVLGFFAAVALAMAGLGLYGVVSYAVAQRTQEIGIRMALGAERRGVLAMVAWQGVKLAGIGVIAGFAAAVALGRLIASQLFQVSPFDPITFALTATVLITTALLASVIPARRASKVDPMVALRYE